jgi:predicted RNase H-like HicB family nuclease
MRPKAHKTITNQSKNLSLMQILNVTITWLDNFGAFCEEIPGVIATHETLEGVKEAFIEALEFHIEGLESDELHDLPFDPKKRYGIHFDLNTQALLKSLSNIFTLAAISRFSGINQKQLGHYLSGSKRPRKIQKEKIEFGINSLKKEIIVKTEKVNKYEAIL